MGINAKAGANDRFTFTTHDGYREGGAEAEASPPAVFVLIPHQAAGHFPLRLVEDGPGNSPVIFGLEELPHGPAVLSDFSPLG